MRLARAAHALHVAAWIGMVLAILVTAAGLLGAMQGGPGPGGAVLDTGGLPLAWAASLAAAQGLLVAAALYQLAALSGDVEPARLFPPRMGQRFGRFALFLLGAVLVHGVVAAVVAALLAPHGGLLAINLDTADVLAVLVMVVLLWVARFLDAAARLEEDQHSII